MPHIEHLALFASDLAGLKDWYVEVLGLRVIVDNSKAPVAGYFLEGDGGSALEIIRRPEGEPGAETRYVFHVAFRVEDYDSARADLARRGIRFEPDTAVHNDAMRTEFFGDPEGNRLQIL